MSGKYLKLFSFSISMLAFISMNAQKKVPFLEKWNASQVKADSIAEVYLEKYPDVKHFKTTYKTFYDSTANKEIILDMFIEVPKGKGPFPVVLFMHGGGFVSGDKSNFTPQTFSLATKGVAAISIEYRLRGHGGNYQLFMEDVMDAIDFVRKNAYKYKINFSELGLAGGSAGAGLSSFAAMKTNECKCFIGYNGGYNTINLNAIESTVKSNKSGIPLLQIKMPPPATLLFHGKEDTTIDYRKSISFAQAIREKGGNAEVFLYDGQKHGFFNQEPYLSETNRELVEFVLQVFKIDTKK